MEGAKYTGDSPVACLVDLSYPLHSICVGLNANVAVVILQTYCQMKLHRSPCSDTRCFNNDIATTFWAAIIFFLWVPWFIVRLQWFWRASSTAFSFIYRNPLVWWHFWLVARHFTDSSLKGPFFDFLGRVSFRSWGNFWFFCVIFCRLFMKAKSSSRKCSFFPDDCQLRSRQHRHFCSRLNFDLLFHSVVALWP